MTGGITCKSTDDTGYDGKVKAIYNGGTAYNYKKPICTTDTSTKYVSIIGAPETGKINVVGRFGSSSKWTTTSFSSSGSDARLKENISDSQVNGISVIRRIQHRQFNWKSDGRHDDVGYIAQELETIDPRLVYPPVDDEDIYAVNTLYLQAVTTKALQELITVVDTLKSRIAELEEVKEK